jgi:DNA-directed RNA polymerase alpha subunit
LRLVHEEASVTARALQDEVLAHRLGLVPLLLLPELFEPKSAEEAASEKNTVVFKLDVTCRRCGGEAGVAVRVAFSMLCALGGQLPRC